MEQIVILSGKGGTGKTCLSAAFATINNNMVVADCDVDAANLHLILQPVNQIEEPFITGAKAVIDETKCSHCGLCAEKCRFGAIAEINGKITISETACDGCKFCARICPEQAISMVHGNSSRWFMGNYRNGTLIYARLTPHSRQVYTGNMLIMNK